MKNLGGVAGLLMIAFLFNAFGCVSREKREAEKQEVAALEQKIVFESPEAQHAAVETGADLSTEVSFRRGSSDLTAASSARLNRFLKNALKKGAINEVRTVAWADADYPAENTESLSIEDKRLADRRNETLKKAIDALISEEGVPAPRLVAVNMTERPGTWAEWFGGKDAQVKNSLEGAGIPVKGRKPASSVSKAAKGMVLLTLERGRE